MDGLVPDAGALMWLWTCGDQAEPYWSGANHEYHSCRRSFLRSQTSSSCVLSVEDQQNDLIGVVTREQDSEETSPQLVASQGQNAWQAPPNKFPCCP